jgi:hypothetical protein
MELASSIGFPPLLGNNTKLSSILQGCQAPKGNWRDGDKIRASFKKKRLFQEASQSKIEMRDKMQNLNCKFQKDEDSPLKSTFFILQFSFFNEI